MEPERHGVGPKREVDETIRKALDAPRTARDLGKDLRELYEAAGRQATGLDDTDEHERELAKACLRTLRELTPNKCAEVAATCAVVTARRHLPDDTIHLEMATMAGEDPDVIEVFEIQARTDHNASGETEAQGARQCDLRRRTVNIIEQIAANGGDPSDAAARLGRMVIGTGKSLDAELAPLARIEPQSKRMQALIAAAGSIVDRRGWDEVWGETHDAHSWLDHEEWVDADAVVHAWQAILREIRPKDTPEVETALAKATDDVTGLLTEDRNVTRRIAKGFEFHAKNWRPGAQLEAAILKLRQAMAGNGTKDLSGNLAVRDGWQHAVLEQILAEHRSEVLEDSLQIRLVNPHEERELDALIVEELWPRSEQTVARKGLLLRTRFGDDERQLDTAEERHTTRRLSGVVEDPARPGGPEGPDAPWACWLIIQASRYAYTIDVRTVLHFRHTQEELALALVLLREPMMRGCPPEMSWCAGSGDETGYYTVHFENGRGRDRMPIGLIAQEATSDERPQGLPAELEDALRWDEAMKEEARNDLEDMAAGLVAITQAMDRYVASPSTAAGRDLRNTVLQVHVAY